MHDTHSPTQMIVITGVRRGQGSARETLRRENPERGSRTRGFRVKTGENSKPTNGEDLPAAQTRLVSSELGRIARLTTVDAHTSGLMHRSKQHLYSITSSARTSKGSGIVRPSAFAVLRLMTRSNLVACSTGRSPALAPLRILSM